VDADHREAEPGPCASRKRGGVERNVRDDGTASWAAAVRAASEASVTSMSERQQSAAWAGGGSFITESGLLRPQGHRHDTDRIFTRSSALAKFRLSALSPPRGGRRVRRAPPLRTRRPVFSRLSWPERHQPGRRTRRSTPSSAASARGLRARRHQLDAPGLDSGHASDHQKELDADVSSSSATPVGLERAASASAL
jgi:hypothetical protein